MAKTSEEKLQNMLASRKRSQERAREKAQKKLADPEWRQQQYAKQRAQQQASLERQREKAKTPATRQQPKPVKKVKPSRKKAYGSKGRTPTAEERRYMALLGALPCIACHIHGKTTYPVGLHHTDGRVAPDAHKRCLPICDNHHQHAAPKEVRLEFPWLVPVHADGSVGGKAEFEQHNGSQDSLLQIAYEMAGIDRLINTN